MSVSWAIAADISIFLFFYFRVRHTKPKLEKDVNQKLRCKLVVHLHSKANCDRGRAACIMAWPMAAIFMSFFFPQKIVFRNN